jgi:outer membrane lipoprotein SlyB
MRKFLLVAILASVGVTTTPAMADRRDYRGGRGYYADQHYRAGPQYRERRLGRNDRIYRGRDGRYYCSRNDGTTGLIIGGIAGGVLGNTIASGGSKTLGTLLGGAGGALLGRSIDRDNVRCR